VAARDKAQAASTPNNASLILIFRVLQVSHAKNGSEARMETFLMRGLKW
jgi:hypothetical protein